MPTIIPAMNVLWFCFPDEKHRRLLLGTPEDCIRKFEALEKSLKGLLEGMEIYLGPSRLKSVDEFTPGFYRKFSKLGRKTVHIGDSDHEFLLEQKMPEQLSLLAEMLERLEVKAVILHAHHLRYDRLKKREVLASTMPNTEIYVENNGGDNDWGHSIKALVDIFEDCPEYGLCLDTNHIKDFKKYSLDDLLSTGDLKDRIRQIHFSYSTRFDGENLYEKLGYPGEQPFHALWSVLGISPSQKTIEFVRQYPVIIEGVQPPEETDWNFLKKEIEMLK